MLNYKDKDYAKQLSKVGRIDVYFDNSEWIASLMTNYNAVIR